MNPVPQKALKPARHAMVVLAILSVVSGALMIHAMSQETATVDETTFMGGGYARLMFGSLKAAEENPILIQMLLAAPMLAQQVHIPDEARAIVDGRLVAPMGLTWDGRVMPLRQLFPNGINWYHNALAEAQHFGRVLVYDRHNNAERLLFASRLVAVLFTLTTGALVFYWTRGLTQNDMTGLMAAALWLFNPLALGYGHLAITEPAITLFLPLAVWWFVRAVQQPTPRNIMILGALTALALEMKFLSLILGPIYLILLGIHGWMRRQLPTARQCLAWTALFVAGAWAVILLIYFPHWSPPPRIEPSQAQLLGVPWWFRDFRPLLIPGDFFKAVTLKLLHARSGHDAFLMGEWSRTGWWYYYPLAMLLKTPVPLLLLIVSAIAVQVSNLRRQSLPQLAPWIAAAVFVLASMTSTVNIGVRHVLPVYPLLAVGVAITAVHLNRRFQIGAGVLTFLLIATAFAAHPHHISYCNIMAGGTTNGYRTLIDSNYDWGQDGKRLKDWMTVTGVEFVHLDFFGTQTAIEWHGIPNQRVNAQIARQLQDGWLVVSVSNLMHPEWDWLRNSRPPDARIGLTLFAYRL